MKANIFFNLVPRPHTLAERKKMEVIFPIRSLDCVNYSQCLFQAARQCLPTHRFSCAECTEYEKERIGDAGIVREEMQALKLLRAVWKNQSYSSASL
jgi:hypothetical protein